MPPSTTFAPRLPGNSDAANQPPPSADIALRSISAASGGAILLAVAYYLGARVGFALQPRTDPHSILWLPNSILLSALLLAPRRHWPWFFVVAYPAHLAVAAHANAPLGLLSILYLTNWLDAALGASLVLYFVQTPVVLSRLRNMIVFIVLAATFSTLLVSLADAAIMYFGGQTQDYWAAWSARSRSNSLTNIVWVPTVLGLREVLRAKRLRADWPQFVWAVLLILLTAGLAMLAFSRPPVDGSPGLYYAPMPILLVGAVVFGVGVVGAQLLLLATAASWSILQATQVTAREVFALQLFLYTMAVPLLCFASVTAEWRRTSVALRASERRVRRQFARLKNIYGNVPLGLAFIDQDLRLVNANENIVRLSEGTMPGRGAADIYTCLPALAPQLAPLLRIAFEHGEPIQNYEITITQRTMENPFVDCLVSCVPVFDSYGNLMGANTVVQDVTERKRVRQALQESFHQLQESNARRLDLAGRMISAQEAERQRIARELHDDFSQRLAEISIELGIVRSQLENTKSSLGDQVGRVRSRSMELSAAMRELSHNLHPSVLKHAGLGGALRGLCDHFAKQQAIQVNCSADVPEDMPDEVALCLYRIAQESLSNVARHAKAKHVQLTLVRRSPFLELTVRDDGAGFEPAAVYKHLGLFSIKERARLLNGTVTIDSARGYGTMVRAVVPLLDARNNPA